MTMIEVHSFSNKEPVWIAVDRISSIERIQHSILKEGEKDYTEIWTSDESNFLVLETPDQIKTAIGFTVIKCVDKVNQVSSKNKVPSKSPTEVNKKKFKRSHYSMTVGNKSKRRTPFTGFRTDY